MHDRLFARSGGPITDAELYSLAAQIPLDRAQFAGCLDGGRYKDAWRASQEEGSRIGVSSTPTFFVNGRMVIGAVDYASFARIVDEEIPDVSRVSQKTASK
jgi:protein-disulfide isomerase